MNAKYFLLILALGISNLLGSCNADEIIEQNTGETCLFNDLQTIPQHMRALREEYNNQMLKPDSEGNQQSFEKCKADLKAANVYRAKLNNINYLLDDYCPDRNSKRNREHRKDVEKLRNDLKRQIDETDCESLYGE